MDRRLAKLAPSVVIATLALMTAAWAATGDVPLATGERTAEPIAIAAAATGPLVANDHDGMAILSSAALAPGATTAGEVTISNAGGAVGRFSVTAAVPTDAGGPVGGLSALLDLTVSDVTGAAPAVLYTGKLATFRGLALGTFAVGGARRYRFEVAYPAGRTAAMDDPYQGASTSLGLTWSATAIASTPTPPVPVPAPPAPGGSTPVAPAPASAAPAPATPAPTSAAPAPATALTVTLGAPKKAVANGRLVMWLQSNTAATARVTGTVSYSGRKAKLRATTVKLAAGRRRALKLKLPAAAIAPKRRLTVRLSVAATAGGRTTTVKRTLRVTAP